MKIKIKYEGRWGNSFLSGSNDEPLPKNGRKYTSSMKGLKEDDGNYQPRDITHNTVMGILSRLIGDQRKLYQARKSGEYYFNDIEGDIQFEDKVAYENNEMIYLRNMNKTDDPGSYVGLLRGDHSTFASEYSSEFWGILDMDVETLCHFILGDDVDIPVSSHGPETILVRFDEIKKFKVEDIAAELLTETYAVLRDRYEKFNEKKGITALYCSALYIQRDDLSERYDVSSLSSKRGGLVGISVNGITPKDFIAAYSGGKKLGYGNPYIKEEFIKGKVKHLMRTIGGTLEIDLALSNERAMELQTLIDNAGVAVFYLGKKGLAYIEEIQL